MRNGTHIHTNAEIQEKQSSRIAHEFMNPGAQRLTEIRPESIKSYETQHCIVSCTCWSRACIIVPISHTRIQWIYRLAISLEVPETIVCIIQMDTRFHYAYRWDTAMTRRRKTFGPECVPWFFIAIWIQCETCKADKQKTYNKRKKSGKESLFACIFASRPP